MLTTLKVCDIFIRTEVIIIKDRFKAMRKELGLTQQELADAVKCSVGVITNIEYGRATANAMCISAICDKFKVSEQWLRTGEGEMFRRVSRDEEVATFFMSVLSGDDEFKKAFVSALSQIDDEGWKLIKDFAAKLNAQQEKDLG